MSSSTSYRNYAQNCLRMAQNAPDDADRPLWLTMAQSWLRLAEHADRLNLELVSDAPATAEEEKEAAPAVN
jgi:hypothetical protein